MKTKHITIILFVVLAIIQLAVPAKMIYTYNTILAKGKLYKFQIAPIDPTDPFRGNYLIIRIKESEIKRNNAEKWKHNDVIYVILDSDKNTGLAKIKTIVREKPQLDIDFVKAKISYSNDSVVSIDFPFDRYYLEESLAPKVEKIYSAALRDPRKVNYLIVNVIDGEAVTNDLIISGKSLNQRK